MLLFEEHIDWLQHIVKQLMQLEIANNYNLLLLQLLFCFDSIVHLQLGLIVVDIQYLEFVYLVAGFVSDIDFGLVSQQVIEFENYLHKLLSVLGMILDLLGLHSKILGLGFV